MDRLTKEQIKAIRSHWNPNRKQFHALCDMALQSLSQEALGREGMFGEPAPAAPDVTGMVKLAEDYLSLKRTLISGDEIVKLARAFILLAKARSLR